MFSLILFLLFCAPNSFAIDDRCKNNAVPANLTEIEIDYEKFVSNAVYETVIDSGQWGAIYSLTNSFIDAIITDAFPNDLFLVVDGNIQIKNDDYLALLDHYTSLLILLGFLLLFAILVPIVGIIFGCCRCCGNCGGKQQYSESNDKVWTIIYLVSLIVFGAVFMFGLIGTFGTNERIEGGIKELVPSVKTSVKDVKSYFDDTSDHIVLLLVKNFNPLSTAVINRLNDAGDLIYCDLQDIVDTDNITDSLDDLKSLDNANIYLDNIKDAKTLLKDDLINIEDTKTNTRELVLSIKNDVSEDIQELIDTVVFDIDSIKLNISSVLIDAIDFTAISNGLKPLNIIVETVEHGLDEFQNLPIAIKDTLSDSIQKVEKAINETGKEIQTQSQNVLNSVNEIVNTISEKSDQYLDEAHSFLDEYRAYRYYPDFVVCIVLLAIIVFIIIGIILGITFKKPSNKKDCCNAKIGSSCLMISVSFMFITTLILVLIVIVHMLGMIAQVMVCKPLKDPNLEIMEFLDNFNILQDVVDANVSSIIRDCYADQSLYNVFNLNTKLNLEEIANSTENLEDYIKEMIDEISNNIPKIDIIDPELLEKLIDLGSIDFPSHEFDIIIELEDQDIFDDNQFITLINNLNNLSNNLLSRGFEAVIEKINKIIDNIENNIIPSNDKMLENIKILKDNGKLANESLSIDGAISSLATNLNETNNNLNKLPDSLRNIATNFTGQILEEIQKYLDFVVDNVEHDVGKCGPLATALKGTVAAACDQIVFPVNGFWFSLFLCLLLFVPMIILSVKIGNLFKKIDSGAKKGKQTSLYYEMPTNPGTLEHRFNPNAPLHNINERLFNNDIDDDFGRTFGSQPKSRVPNQFNNYNDIDDELEKRFGVTTRPKSRLETSRNNFSGDNNGYVPEEFQSRYTFAKPSGLNNSESETSRPAEYDPQMPYFYPGFGYDASLI